MIPRLACVPPSSGFDLVSARKPRSASSSRPAMSARRAFSKSRCTAGLSGTSVSIGAEGSTCATAPSGDGALFCAGAAGAFAVVGAAGTGSAGLACVGAAVGAAGWLVGGVSGPVRTAQPEASAINVPAKQMRDSGSANCIDDHLTEFDLAVTSRPQFREGGKTLFDPLVIDALCGAVRIHLVQLDRLLFEREGLLLEQHVVLLQLELRKFFRPL